MIEYYKNFSLENLFYINHDGLVYQEEWKDVIGFEDIYQVSNLGRVKSLDRKCVSFKKDGSFFYRFMNGKIMGQTLEKDLYLRINLTDINKKRIRLITHRIQSIAFIPNPLNLPDVNHKNGIKSDNRVYNLEWVTKSENIQHAVDTGLFVSCKGEKHGKSKLKEKDVLEIRKLKGVVNHKEIAKQYNVSRSTIVEILNKKTWKHI